MFVFGINDSKVEFDDVYESWRWFVLDFGFEIVPAVCSGLIQTWLIFVTWLWDCFAGIDFELMLELWWSLISGIRLVKAGRVRVICGPCVTWPCDLFWLRNSELFVYCLTRSVVVEDRESANEYRHFPTRWGWWKTRKKKLVYKLVILCSIVTCLVHYRRVYDFGVRRCAHILISVYRSYIIWKPRTHSKKG